MFLDGERPRMLPDAGVIILDKKQLAQISAAPNHFAAQKVNDESRQNQKPKSRINLKAAPYEKLFYINVAALFVFVKQQTGNQKPAQNKK